MPREFGEMERGRKDDIDTVLSAYRSVRTPVAYVSMPITTGKRLYDVLERKGVKTLDELASIDTESVRSDIIKPNIERGIEVADDLRGRIKLPPIAPSVFDATKKGWSQRDYLLMWLRVIAEKADEVYMTDGWEYSDGSAREFQAVMSMQFDSVNLPKGIERFPEGCDLEKDSKRLRKVKAYDECGKEIRIEKGFNLIADAARDLRRRGFGCKGIFEPFHDLMNIVAYYNEPWAPKGSWEMQPYIDYSYGDMIQIFREIVDIRACQKRL